MTSQESNPYALDDRLNREGQTGPDVGDAGAAGPEVPPAAPRAWNSASLTNVLLAVVFVAGVGSLYLLSRGGTPEVASADQKLAELRVDSALPQLLKLSAKSDRAMEVVNTFYYQAKQRQIPMSNLKSNPFVFRPPWPLKATTLPKGTPRPAAKVEKKPQQELEDVKKLVLQSVLVGSREPMAMISNNLLTEGQKISGWTVTRIEPRKVTLTWQDKTYVLQMSE